MNAAPAVSVLMGVRNGLPYLREAIDSVLAQTFTDLELIVVEDASTDATPELLGEIGDPRLVVLRNDENLGLTRSLNRALRSARGTYVARQDADDRSLPQRIERQFDYLERHPEIGLCGTWARFVDGHGRVTALGLPPSDPDRLAGELRRSNEIVHGTIVARRELMQALHGYREGFRYAQDYDLYLRALDQRWKLAVVPEVLYDLRFHDAAITGVRGEAQTRFAALARLLSEQRLERGRDDVEAGESPESLLARNASLSEVEIRRRQTMYRRLSGDMRGYRRALAGMVRIDPRDSRHYVHLLLSLGGRRALMAADRLAARSRRGRGPPRRRPSPGRGC